MKTNNYIVLIVSAIIAAVLLFLWYNLGFCNIDSPLDLVLAIVWWVGIVAIVALIMRFENTRKSCIRTIYIGEKELFNSEKGLAPIEAGDVSGLVGGMLDVLKGLKYSFSREEMPAKEDFGYRFVVRTDTFKAAETDDAELTWEGSVVKIDRANGNAEVPFKSLDELKAALS